jgi:hypothetical protein
MAFDTPNRTSHSTRLFALDIGKGCQALDNADEALRVGMARSGEHLFALGLQDLIAEIREILSSDVERI